MIEKQYMLVILDGIGLNDEEQGNAFKQANTPNIDALISKYPNTHIETSGLAVGLPEGQMGNSEVGHMTIGSGRVIYQDLTLISKDIKSGEFNRNKAILTAIKNSKDTGNSLHIMGLLSDGGVHSHIDHLYAILKLAKSYGLEKVFIHAFMDGRDKAPTSGIEYLKQLEDYIRKNGVGKIASITGRYYAMDRDNRWDRVELAYRALTEGEGSKFKTVQKAMENSYEAQEFDEFIKPIILVDEEGNPTATIKDNDSVIFINFRPDRAREITKALTENDFDGFERRYIPKNLTYVTMTEYDERFKKVIVAYTKKEVKNTLGEYLAKKEITQARIAETEKYAHVTFFFDSGIEKKYRGEDTYLIASSNVATYDLKPEMSAPEITEKVIEIIEGKKHDLIIINFANGDMVGHTGNLEKTIEAVETVDTCLNKIVEKLEEVNGSAIITADHGNAEQMIDLKTGEVITSHTTFDVPMIIIDDNVKSVRSGALSDIAPTILDVMGIKKPEEMTGNSLIEKIKE